MGVRPPAGFRDFPPEVMLLRKKVIKKIEEIFQRYGYDPIDTPTIEYWDVLKGKYGEEAEKKLIWRFKDVWSGREYAFRYDLTVPLARFVALHRDMPLPFKRYHIGPVWRHEEPQRGRYREFYQCDADVVGSPYPDADAEIINITIDVMKAFNFSQFTVRVNDRRMLRGIFEEELGIENPYPVYVVIDKLDKIGMDGVLNQLGEMLPRDKVEKIADIISVRGEPLELLDEVSRKYGDNPSVKQAVNHLSEMFDLIDDLGNVALDLSLVRGLDYYTGPIFETVVEKPRIGSLTGGGRYDGLIGIFSGVDIPATGTSIGIERLIDAGLELGIFKLDKKTVTQIYVVVLDEKAKKEAWKLAHQLRTHGFKVSVDLSRRKPDKQRKHAKRLDIPVLIYVGKKEVEQGTATIYLRKQQKRIEVPRENLPQELEKHL